MSAWAPDSALTGAEGAHERGAYFGAPGSPESSGSSGASQESGTLLNSTEPEVPVRPLKRGPSSFTSGWLKLIPFFVSALLFVSRLFAVLAPLPLVLLALRSPRSRGLWLGILTNSVLVYFLSGPSDLWLFFVWVATVAVALPFFLRRTRSVGRATTRTLISMLVAAGVILAVHSQIHHVNPFREFKAVVYEAMDQTLKGMPPENRTAWLGEMEPAEWKQNVFVEIPWILGVFSLVTVGLNLALALRINPQKLRESLGIDPAYFRKWKAPELLLWPTIISGFCLLLDLGWGSDIALNVFKFLMAIYAIQGLSILSFFFDAWNVRGPFRTLAYLVAISLMLPLVLSLGFFDLWFDFRSKLRQS